MGSGNRVPPSRDSPSPPSRAPSTIFFWPRSRVTPAGPGACKWEERARVGTGAPGCSEQPVQWEHPKGCPGNGRLPGQPRGWQAQAGGWGPVSALKGQGHPHLHPQTPIWAGCTAGSLHAHLAGLGHGGAGGAALSSRIRALSNAVLPGALIPASLCTPIGVLPVLSVLWDTPFFARRSLGRVIWDSHKASLWTRRFRPRHLPPTPRSTPAGGSGRDLGGSQRFPYLFGACLPAPQPRENLQASPRPAPPGPRPERGRCPGC